MRMNLSYNVIILKIFIRRTNGSIEIQQIKSILNCQSRLWQQANLLTNFSPSFLNIENLFYHSSGRTEEAVCVYSDWLQPIRLLHFWWWWYNISFFNSK